MTSSSSVGFKAVLGSEAVVVKNTSDLPTHAVGDGVRISCAGDGSLQWTDSNARTRTLSCAAASGATFALPNTSGVTLADTNSVQVLNNKSITLSGLNTVEANKIFGKMCDDAIVPTTGDQLVRYDAGTGKWAISNPLNADAPLVFNPVNYKFSAQVGSTPSTLCAGDDNRFKSHHMLTVKLTDVGAGEFAHISDALAYIEAQGDAADDDPYIVHIEPGTYVEPLLSMPNFTSLVGYEIYSVIIRPDAANHNVINMHHGNELSFLTIEGYTGSGCIGVYYTGLDAGGLPSADPWMQLHKVEISNCDYCIKLESQAWIASYLEYVEMYGDYINAIYQDGSAIDPGTGNPYTNYLGMENTHVWATSNNSRTADIFIHGAGCMCRMVVIAVVGIARDDLYDLVPLIKAEHGCVVQLQCGYLSADDIEHNVKTGVGLQMSDGARATVTAMVMLNMIRAVHVLNGGVAPYVDVDAMTASSDQYCILVEHPTAYGLLKGNGVIAKCSVASNFFSVSIYDMSTLSPVFTVGDVTVGAGSTNRLALGAYAVTQGLGAMTGGEITATGGLDIQIAAGTGYLAINSDTTVTLISYTMKTATLTASITTFLYIDESAALVTSFSDICACNLFYLGCVATSAAGVMFISQRAAAQTGKHLASRVEHNMKRNFGPIATDGMLGSFDGSDAVTITGGSYMLGGDIHSPSGKVITTVGFTQLHSDVDDLTWIPTAVSAVITAFYNPSGSTLVGLAGGDYARHSLFVGAEAARESYFLVVSQNKSAVLGDCDAMVNRVPTWAETELCPVVDIVTRCGATPAIIRMYDTRPFATFNRSVTVSPATATSHSALLHLADSDDHPQYLRTDGTRVVTGDMNLGGHAITGITLMDGVNYATHGARHDPTGADPLSIGGVLCSQTVTAVSTNSRGIAASYALSDHSHALDVSAVDITSLSGSMTVARGGTGLGALTANTFITAADAATMESTKVVPAGTVVGTTDAQALTNKTITPGTGSVLCDYLQTTDANKVNMTAAVRPLQSGYVLVSSHGTVETGPILCTWMPSCLPILRYTAYQTAPSGTNGGALTQLTWTARAFTVGGYNTSDMSLTDPMGWGRRGLAGNVPQIALSGGNLILYRGRYRVYGWAMAYRVGGNKTRLFNTTLSSAVTFDGGVNVGASGYANPANQGPSSAMTRIEGGFEIPAGGAETNTIRLEHWANSTFATGQGVAVGGGSGIEIYASLEIIVVQAYT